MPELREPENWLHGFTALFGESLLMDKAYEGGECRAKAKKCGMRPVVLPKSNRLQALTVRQKLFNQRYIVECNFRIIKQFRRLSTRYGKLDETYNAFIAIGLKN